MSLAIKTSNNNLCILAGTINCHVVCFNFSVIEGRHQQVFMVNLGNMIPRALAFRLDGNVLVVGFHEGIMYVISVYIHVLLHC